VRRAVFLDRDGVVNRALVLDGKPHPPASLATLRIIPGVRESLAALKAQGYLLIVVTNQPDVSRGTTPRDAVERMHAYLQRQLPLDAIYTCFHDDADRCDCRKPAPGLLLRAALDYGVKLASSCMIGDRWRDMQAGARAGCATFFIHQPYDEPEPLRFDHRVASLGEACSIILQRP
jgi:D-glycero-D-manno-heptose 1,7-bisphosphate phosphatase